MKGDAAGEVLAALLDGRGHSWSSSRHSAYSR